MQDQRVHTVSRAIGYIEDHLNGRLELATIAEALHYSKFHLHRIFRKTVGLTVHEYVQRRQLTEAARLLVFSKKPIMEVALMSGYESRQAFTTVFKSMYKTAPAEFRKAGEFYPLQLAIHLDQEAANMDFTKDDIKFAVSADVDDWMDLVRLTIDGYPGLKESEYMDKLCQYIAEKKALILRSRSRSRAIGIMAFSPDTGSIDFLAVHPQYRKSDITGLFLRKLIDGPLCGREISITTYREGDKADTGYRGEYYRLGFAGKELLMEYGYPVQRFVFYPWNGEDTGND